mmetsp:Transcript_57901/g.159835  ORF Transcript_57901/g.159835 Transcript_57901/m.159835 type:complete len:224 (+) Transcript_57901:2508-3179(+)
MMLRSISRTRLSRKRHAVPRFCGCAVRVKIEQHLRRAEVGGPRSRGGAAKARARPLRDAAPSASEKRAQCAPTASESKTPTPDNQPNMWATSPHSAPSPPPSSPVLAVPRLSLSVRPSLTRASAASANLLSRRPRLRSECLSSSGKSVDKTYSSTVKRVPMQHPRSVPYAGSSSIGTPKKPRAKMFFSVPGATGASLAGVPASAAASSMCCSASSADLWSEID